MIRFIILFCILIFSSHTFANLYECQMKPKKIKGTYWLSSKDSMKMNGNFKNLDIIIDIFYENLNNKWSVKGFDIDEKILKKMQDKELSIFKKDIHNGKFS